LYLADSGWVVFFLLHAVSKTSNAMAENPAVLRIRVIM